MTSAEFAEWIAYANIQPFGQIREDQRAGTIASAIVNVHKKSGSTPLTYRDFFPSYEVRQREELTPGDLLSKVEAINKMLGGTDRRTR